MKGLDEQNIILVELDCLLDTRIGTLSLLDDKAAAALLSEKYTHRVSDNWEFLTDGAVTNEAFNQRYQQRDKDVLKASRPVNLITFLPKLLNDLEKQALSEPITKDLTLRINTYPYKLTVMERRIITECIYEQYTSAYTKVDVVDIAPDKLTPRYLREEVAMVIMYDFNRWLTLHIDQLAANPLPDTHMVIPALDYTLDNHRKVFHGGNSPLFVYPHLALEFILSEFIGLVIRPVKDFSLLDWDDKSEIKD